MKQMRTELRRTLQWCLDQPDAFDITQCMDRFAITRASIGRQFRTLEALGMLGRTITHENHHLYWIKDCSLVKKALRLTPVATVPVPKRRGMPRMIINSVFSLGML